MSPINFTDTDYPEPERPTAKEINKTRSDFEALKQSWLKDPCWDIEDTEGFEFYHDELKAFRMEREYCWKKEHEARKNIDYLDKAKDLVARPGDADWQPIQALALIAIAEELRKMNTRNEINDESEDLLALWDAS